MQTPKSRPGSLEVPQKKSPAATPKTARRLKTGGTESDPVSSPNPTGKTPKHQSPKVVAERRSPRTPASEKKRPGKVPEMESQLSQLQEDLKKAKEQINTSEALKRKAQEEAEEAKQQLMEITASEDSRIDELRKLSQERDKAWQSELEAMQRQHAMDSAALSSAMNEIQKLKAQLSGSESAPQMKHAEQTLVENLRVELSETLSLVEKLRGELFDAKESEAQAREMVSGTEKQLEIANLTLEMLRSDGMKMSEACNSLTAELDQSKAEIRSLEELVKQLEEEHGPRGSRIDQSEDVSREKEEVDKLKEELNHAKHEINQLKSALEVAERRYHEEYIQSTLQIRSAYEQVEAAKSENSQRETELDKELKRARTEAEALRERLTDKEAKLRIIAEENEALNVKIKEFEELTLQNSENQKDSEFKDELKRLEGDILELKANLMDKEMELQSVTAQNDSLKTEMEKMQTEKNEDLNEALGKLRNLTEEADKNSKRAENATEQLGAAQVTNTELESELRRLKVQCDQWRKAAEAAASIIAGSNNNGNNDGKYVERTRSLESPFTKNANTSPYLDDTDDDLSPKKKNGNMLKKIGVLLRKGQK